MSGEIQTLVKMYYFLEAQQLEGHAKICHARKFCPPKEESPDFPSLYFIMRIAYINIVMNIVLKKFVLLFRNIYKILIKFINQIQKIKKLL